MGKIVLGCDIVRRKYKTRRRNKQKKIIVISICSLLLIMTAGYAAMQTNLSIKAKGNIIKNTIDITDNVVNSGDGLYIDTYETEGTRYVYKGANPNNYIEFNNELWRIIAKEADGTYKIIRNENIGNNSWDETNNSNWARPATLNTYLNGEYLNTLTETDKIISHNFSIGTITDNNNDLAVQIIEENKTIWQGKIGLITVSDYLKANTNTQQCETLSSNNNNFFICSTTNWIYGLYTLSAGYLWTISSSENRTFMVGSDYSGDLCLGLNDPAFPIIGVFPVIHISSDIIISNGDGSKNFPFRLSN